MGFLRGFYSQDVLFSHIDNQFRYVDNMQKDSLLIYMSEPYQDEAVNAAPALIIQEGGFSEVTQATNNNQNYWSQNRDSHFTPFQHPYTIHCISQTKASCKLLQAATAKAIATFRHAIYEMGVDNISAIQGSPPMRIGMSDETIPGYYDATIMFNMKMDQHWILSRSGDVLEQIRLNTLMWCAEAEFDENGAPAGDWIEQAVNVNWNS